MHRTLNDPVPLTLCNGRSQQNFRGNKTPNLPRLPSSSNKLNLVSSPFLVSQASLIPKIHQKHQDLVKIIQSRSCLPTWVLSRVESTVR